MFELVHCTSSDFPSYMENLRGSLWCAWNCTSPAAEVARVGACITGAVQGNPLGCGKKILDLQ